MLAQLELLVTVPPNGPEQMHQHLGDVTPVITRPREAGQITLTVHVTDDSVLSPSRGPLAKGWERTRGQWKPGREQAPARRHWRAH